MLYKKYNNPEFITDNNKTYSGSLYQNTSIDTKKSNSIKLDKEQFISLPYNYYLLNNEFTMSIWFNIESATDIYSECNIFTIGDINSNEYFNIKVQRM